MLCMFIKEFCENHNRSERNRSIVGESLIDSTSKCTNEEKRNTECKGTAVTELYFTVVMCYSRCREDLVKDNRTYQ